MTFQMTDDDIFEYCYVSVPTFIFLHASLAFVFQISIGCTFASVRISAFDLGIRYSEYFNP